MPNHAIKNTDSVSTGAPPRWWIIVTLAALLSAPTLATAEVRASLDRQQLYEGDALTLVIEASGQDTKAQPDLTPLQQDFDVLGTSRSTQVSIVNFHSSSSLRWQITLAPKHLGTLTIPALEVGGEKTAPLTVTVRQAPQGALGGPGDEVFVELDLERPEGTAADDPVLVQQQLPLVVRLYSALPLRGGTLSEPRADGAVLERLGPDQRYGATRNGREYEVIERRYSLSPEHSGDLRIPPVVFEGELTPTASRGKTTSTQRSRMDRMFEDFPFASSFSSDPFSMFEPGKRVRAQSQAVNLTVAGRPDDFSGAHWLPAEALEITDSWAEQPPELQVGKPVTRTLTLTAKGLAGNQIPDVEMRFPADVRAYRDPTEQETRTDGQVVYAVSRQAVTVIPTKAGALELPELKVRWWDITAKAERETRVPGLSIPVAPGAASAQEADQPLQAPVVNAAREEPTPASAAPVAESPSVRAGEAAPAGLNAAWLIAALLGLLVLAAAGVLVMMKVRQRQHTSVQPTGKPALDSLARTRLGARRAQVREAASRHSAKDTAEALLALARATWPDDPPLNLSALARQLGAQATAPKSAAAAQAASTAILELERALYAPTSTNWNGDTFWQAVSPALSANAATHEDASAELPPLYPDRR